MDGFKYILDFSRGHYSGTNVLLEDQDTFICSPWLSNTPYISFIGNPWTKMIYGKLDLSEPAFVGADFLKYQWWKSGGS